MPDKSDNPLTRILRGDKQAGKEDPLPLADESEDGALTIADMDGRYSTTRPSNKQLTRIHVIKKDGKVFTFQYAFLDAQSTFDGKEFKVLFAGVKHWEITVKGYGKDFWRVYDLITLHRFPYLREAMDRPFAGEDVETALTEIRIAEVTPRESEN